MLTAEVVPPEAARYAATLVLVPGLWTAPSVWRRSAGFLAHRGWECHAVDVRSVAGGTAARAEAVAAYVGALGGPAVLVGHDAGAWVAARAAARTDTAAAVLLAPLVPRRAAVRALAFERRVLWPLVVGRPVPPPAAAEGLWGDTPGAGPTPVETGVEDPAVVREVLWGRLAAPARVGVPTLVAVGAADPFLAPADATALATRLGADVAVVPEAGHCPLGPRSFQATAAVLHRWVVHRLGAPLLELYPEAMAARGDDEDDA